MKKTKRILKEKKVCEILGNSTEENSKEEVAEETQKESKVVEKSIFEKTLIAKKIKAKRIDTIRENILGIKDIYSYRFNHSALANKN